MKTYIGKLFLQMAIIWIVLSSCFPVCCDSKNSKIPLSAITLENPTDRKMAKRSEGDSIYVKIIGQYPGFIELIQSLINTPPLETKIKQEISENLKNIQFIYNSLNLARPQAEKLQKAQNIRDNLSNMIKAIKQLDQVPNIHELQKLLQQIKDLDALFEQFIKAIQDQDTKDHKGVQEDNTVAVVVDEM